MDFESFDFGDSVGVGDNKVIDDKNNDLYFGMPEYNNVDLPDPVVTCVFKFRSTEDFEEFNALLKKHIYNGAKIFDGMQKKDKKSAWYPLNDKPSNYEYR